MIHSPKTERAMHLAGYNTIAGMLHILISQRQKGEALTPEEISRAFAEGEAVLNQRLEAALAETEKLLEGGQKS